MYIRTLCLFIDKQLRPGQCEVNKQDIYEIIKPIPRELKVRFLFVIIQYKHKFKIDIIQVKC